MWGRSLFLSLLLCIALVQRTAAQEEPIRPDTLRAAANPTATDTLRQEAVLTWSLKSNDFLGYIHEDLGDLLRYLPEAHAVDRGRIGQLSTASVRGSAPGEAQILLSNRPYGDPFDGIADLTALPVLPIQSIEVYRTGAFLPYGLNPMGGALRVEPRPHARGQPISEVRFRTGYYGYNDVEAFYSQRLSKRASFSGGGGLRDVTGFFPNTGHKGENWFLDLQWSPPPGWQTRYAVFHTRNDADVPGLHIPEGLSGSSRHRKEVRTDHLLEIQRLAGNRMSISAVAYLSALRREFRERTTGLFVVHEGDVAGGAAEWRLIAGRHRLSAGAGAELEDVRGDVIDGDDARSRVYIRDEFRPATNLRIGLQVGAEIPRRHPAFLTLRGYTLWSPAANLQTWVGWERTRRTPAAMERLWPGPKFEGNPDLLPARSWAYEMGAQLGREDKARLRAALYYRRTTDWIGIASSDSVLRPANLGSRRLWGADFEARVSLWQRAGLGVVGQWIRVVETEPAMSLDTPEIVVNGYAEVSHTFFQDLHVTARGFVRVLGQRWSLRYPRPVVLFADVLLDGMILLRFKDARIFFSMEDVFDRRPEEVAGFPRIGQVFRWGLNWRFLD